MPDYSERGILNWALKDVYEFIIPDLLLANSKSVWGVWCGKTRYLWGSSWRWRQNQAMQGLISMLRSWTEFSKQGVVRPVCP